MKIPERVITKTGGDKLLEILQDLRWCSNLTPDQRKQVQKGIDICIGKESR